MLSRAGGLIGLVLALGIMAIAGVANANDGTPPWVFELVQQGQDVRVTLAIVSEGEPGMGEPYGVTRDGPEGTATVVEERVFGADDVGKSQGECRGGGSDPEACAADPADCTLDCNGDGTPECRAYDGDSWCDTVNYITVTDSCVPPGTTTYTLAEVGTEYAYSDSSTIEVTDEAECVNETSGGTSDGCSVAGSMGSSPAPLLALFMLGTGLVALQRRRKA